MSRIAVVGVGAIGGTVAAHLASSGAHELVLCVRDVFDELVVETPFGELRASLRTVTRPNEVGPVDWAPLATKAHETAGARAWLEARAGPDVTVACCRTESSTRRGGAVRGRGDDLPAERPLEYDARNGAVARIGARHGLEAPLNAMATTLLAALSARFEGR